MNVLSQKVLLKVPHARVSLWGTDFASICVFVIFCQCWFALIRPALTVESRAQEEPYYEYVHKRLQWNTAAKLCNMRSGALATVSRPLENQELTNFLNSLNITQPVWIARKVVTNPTSRFTLPLFTLYKHTGHIDALDFTLFLTVKDDEWSKSVGILNSHDEYPGNIEPKCVFILIKFLNWRSFFLWFCCNQRFLPDPGPWICRAFGELRPSSPQIPAHGLSDCLCPSPLWSKVLGCFHRLLLHQVKHRCIPAPCKSDSGERCSVCAADARDSRAVPGRLGAGPLLALCVCYLDPEWWTVGAFLRRAGGLSGWWSEQFQQHWPWWPLHYWAGPGCIWGPFSGEWVILGEYHRAPHMGPGAPQQWNQLDGNNVLPLFFWAGAQVERSRVCAGVLPHKAVER